MFSGGGAAPARVMGSGAVRCQRHSGGATIATALLTASREAAGTWAAMEAFAVLFVTGAAEMEAIDKALLRACEEEGRGGWVQDGGYLVAEFSTEISGWKL